MSSAIQVMKDAFMGTVDWTWKSIIMDSSVPWYQNYFYGLIVISVAVYLLELAFPWRKEQKAIRKDFWLDGFYMFFNFFIFSIAIAGVYALLELGFQSVGISMKSIALVDMSAWPMALQLLVFFIVIDFVQWATHVALHRFEFLWRFHQVHHSVEEMGFAAHLRYHWMENIFYKPLKTIGVMVLGGFEPEQAYIVHFVAISIGHLNHANIHITWGPLRYVFNNPVMHLWHHVYHLPEGRTHGINFGISLSLWDYLFGTASIPKDDAHIKLGYPGVEDMPKGFWGQLLYGFRRKA
ncbi:sterol desaturase family protein [Sanyastnella coralliicola]|uniref:sterol desaturase family protein n=1 Tax=Sanyastnella coralliicola TaxID=3069118 RepID=UPI0027BA5204|nr:sterol desaturase family protein [Longitalea sp. SCSIO 12813]